MHPKAMKSTCNTSKLLRKGAWGSDEDTLLRKCIEKYGEGKWHLVPHRAGLNRCRKSCRLRWLNYLRPSIKRGEFGEDEVDLMIRLHKLLGNRWSLIAGRLPGRTANDVKNYWNTNLQKKLTTHDYHREVVKGEELIKRKQTSSAATATATTHVVVKPLPRTLSKGTTVACYNLNPKSHMHSPSPSPAKPLQDQDGIEWWKNLFAETNSSSGSLEGMLMTSSSGLENPGAETGLIWKMDESFPPATDDVAPGLLEDGRSCWSDIWDLLNLDY